MDRADCTHPDHAEDVTCEDRAVACCTGCPCCLTEEALSWLADRPAPPTDFALVSPGFEVVAKGTRAAMVALRRTELPTATIFVTRAAVGEVIL